MRFFVMMPKAALTAAIVLLVSVPAKVLSDNLYNVREERSPGGENESKPDIADAIQEQTAMNQSIDEVVAPASLEIAKKALAEELVHEKSDLILPMPSSRRSRARENSARIDGRTIQQSIRDNWILPSSIAIRPISTII